MTSRRPRIGGAVAFVACLLTGVAAVSAQGVEVTPFAGYRFGGDFFELLTHQRLDLDGAPAFGVAVDVPTPKDVQFEALFTRQRATVSVPMLPFGPPVRWRMTVDHYQAGGLREMDSGNIRPFLTGTLGLTRYATTGDSEVRFSLAAGGGVKLFPSQHIGLRLSGQTFVTFADANAQVFACSPGLCFVGFDADVVWQLEFTAGLIFRFP